MTPVLDSAAQAKPADAYHHGDLRAALIAAAREALRTQPPEAVTLKSLAEALGVSQPAPYRHFRSRDALLAAVTADGFRRFEGALRAAAAGDPPAAFLRASLAYLAFARDNPGVYRLMFANGPRPAGPPEPELARAADSAYRLLLESAAPGAPEETAAVRAGAYWAGLHGVAMLEAEGLLPGPDGVLGPEAMAERCARELVQRFDPAAG